MKHIIIANGELIDPERSLTLIRQADWIIAADGGAEHCRKLGVLPHCIVGDLDSVRPKTRRDFERQGTLFEIHPAQKDATDLELALRVALREGAQQVIILAALGGRWDQTLANVLLLTHPDFAALDVCLVSGSDIFYLVREQLTLVGKIGDGLSLLPLKGDAEGVTLTGLEYPLTEATLRFGHTTGVSNVFVTPEATITVKQGMILAIHTNQ